MVIWLAGVSTNATEIDGSMIIENSDKMLRKRQNETKSKRFKKMSGNCLTNAVVRKTCERILHCNSLTNMAFARENAPLLFRSIFAFQRFVCVVFGQRIARALDVAIVVIRPKCDATGRSLKMTIFASQDCRVKPIDHSSCLRNESRNIGFNCSTMHQRNKSNNTQKYFWKCHNMDRSTRQASTLESGNFLGHFT